MGDPGQEQEPWGWYTKDRLPSGFTHPIGRDAIEQELRRVGLEIDDLGLRLPRLPVDPSQISLVSATVSGDAHSTILSARGGRNRTTLRISGMPVDVLRRVDRATIMGECGAAVAWIVETLDRGNAWLAADHSFWSTLEAESIVRHVD